jgi:hypothetical protein
MYKMLNQIESTADLGRVLFIDFMTSPQARSSARDDKGESGVPSGNRLLDPRSQKRDLGHPSIISDAA